MTGPTLHRFELDGRHYAMDPESCFCFECDAISRDVLEYYPQTPVNRILHLLQDRHPRAELEEVIGELEWLRSAKSIAQSLKVADLEKIYAPGGGLRSISAAWLGQRHLTNATAAHALLLGRSATEPELSVELRCGQRVEDVKELAALLSPWPGGARLVGKRLTVALRASLKPGRDLPPALQGHRLEMLFSPHLEAGIAEQLTGFNKALDAGSLTALAKWAQGLPKEAAARVILRPAHARFGGAGKALRDAGFAHIEIDPASAFLHDPAIAPETVFGGMRENAEYYAEALLKRDLFRLDPVAGLFLRIYQGTPTRRTDPAGTHALAVDESVIGHIHPAPEYIELDSHRIGNLQEGRLDEALLASFENTGAATTAACTACWARNLCGGGPTAVHHRLNGSIREPHPAWCAGQRGWMEAAIAAFNRLSTAGVNFVQVYESLGRKQKVSLWQAAKTLLNAPLGLRPLAESDAPLLTKWENWNESAYFVAHEAGVLITNQYDREMDAVHPKGYEQEFLLTNTGGSPIGLLRVRPLSLPGVACAWLFLKDPADYHASATRRGFRNLVDLMPSQQSLRRLLVPVGPKDGALALFLQAAGFSPAGVQREALYLHGAYHDVRWFTLTLDSKGQA